MEIGPTLERLFMSITISRGICCIRIRQWDEARLMIVH
jgi:hypothetical protein